MGLSNLACVPQLPKLTRLELALHKRSHGNAKPAPLFATTRKSLHMAAMTKNSQK